MKRVIVRSVAVALAVTWTAGAYASPGIEEEELALAYGDKSFVSIASGMRQPLSRAPSVATVITAEEIEAIGAADLDEVLEAVPGLHVARTASAYNPVYTIRGIHTQYNSQVLMLVNGIPITSVFVGDRSRVWGGMPVENIARIEVIRGPGSALYGADAVSGVINIITKTAADIDGTQLGLRVGSFNSRDAWVLHGGEWGGLEFAGYLRLGATDGQREIIGRDAATALGTSHAPGPLNLGRDTIDGRLDLARDQWRLRLGYQQRDNVGTGAGAAQALDPSGSNSSERFSADLTYQNANLARDWDMTAQASYFYLNDRSNLVLYPPRTKLGASVFDDGMIGNPYKWESHWRFNLAAAYTGFQDHKLRLGAGLQENDLYRTQETKNYTQPPGSAPIPLGALVDVTDTVPFLRPHSRTVSHVYVQDEWAFAKDWYLTAGVRHDQYSDFGGTTNPRAALVWETAYNFTSKLIYGRAFRPPSFVELYNINNPVALGNPDLKPETIESLELAFAWQPASGLQTGLSLFHYHMNDILRFVRNPDGSSTAQNAGQQRGDGLELEAAWEATRSLRLSGNYALQRSTDVATGRDSGNAPHHHLYARADWRFAPGWTLNTQVNHVADRKREPSDTRPDIPDYHTVDLTLRNRKWRGDWDFALTVRNLFDADAREPSPAPGLIPNDLPLAPRELRFELRHRL